MTNELDRPFPLWCLLLMMLTSTLMGVAYTLLVLGRPIAALMLAGGLILGWLSLDPTVKRLLKSWDGGRKWLLARLESRQLVNGLAGEGEEFGDDDLLEFCRRYIRLADAKRPGEPVPEA